MTDYSETEWVTHILRKATVLGEDEAPTAAALEEAKRVIRSRISHLSQNKIRMFNGSADVVPEEWFDAGADYMALYIGQANGRPPPDLSQVEAALRPLRQMTTVVSSGGSVAGNYY